MILKIHILIWVFGIVLFSCNFNEKLKPNVKPSLAIVKLSNLSWIDSSKTDTGFRIAKFDYFLVKCDGFDSDEIKTGIDHFAKDLEARSPCRYAQCDMLYFKETGETNEKKLKDDKDLIDTYSTKHDLIWLYDWSYNKLIGVSQYSNGLIVNPKATIFIQDLPNPPK
jgi:hypothetical protein